MKHKKLWKKVLIPVIVVAVIAGGLGTWYLLGRMKVLRRKKQNLRFLPILQCRLLKFVRLFPRR